MIRSPRLVKLGLACTTVLVSGSLSAQGEQPGAGAARETAPSTLEQQFQDPPNSARPRVWWHWMNGNVTKDGIAKDLEWMKRVGIGGLQNFDANLQTPQIVDQRLVYMTPAWKEAFRFAAHEADRHGLELAIAASPGWSETGGPWVKPADGLKKLVWSETAVTGGKPFAGKLAAPPSVTGPFQSLPMGGGLEEVLGGTRHEPPRHYADVAVLAFPAPAPAFLRPKAVRDGSGKILAPEGLADDDIRGGVALAPAPGGKAPALVLDYGRPVTVRSASLYVPGASLPFFGSVLAPVIEASDDGAGWRKIDDIDAGAVPATVSFAPVSARYFRLVLEKRRLDRLPAAPAPGVAMGDIFGGMVESMLAKPVTIGDLRLSGDVRVDQFEKKAGYQIVQDYYTLGETGDGAIGLGPDEVIDLTARMKPDGTLDWTPPKGDWRVLRLGYSLLGTTNHPAPPEATGLEVDKFDGEAVRGYMEHYLGMYKDAAGADMVGDHGVRAILTDSIEVGAANWTPRMIEQFKRLRGYDPTPWLPALTGALIGSREDTDRFLYDFRRTLADLMASEHYGTVAKVAHENGLIVYGEALEDHRPSLGDDMTMRKAADVPMAAMWMHRRKEGPKATYVADIRGAASVAHLYGQNLVAAESMTASMAPWAFAPKDLKRVIDLEFVNGINRPVIHTSVHVPVDDRKPGLSLFIFGQFFNRNETWAEMARPWVDYIARSSLLLQQGRNIADVAYFHGEEGPLTALYGDRPVADAPVRHAYDFLSFDALTTLLVNRGADVAAPDGARYRAIYLGGSSRRMTLSVLRKLAALVEGGATVIGKPPVKTPSRMGTEAGEAAEWSALVAKLWPGGDAANIGKGRVIASEDIEAALRSMGVAPDFAFSGGDPDATIPFVHRRDGTGDIYYLTNPQAKEQIIEARFRVTGKQPELWHPETGSSEPVSYRIENGGTVVPLTMRPDDAVFVVFRKDAKKNVATLKAKAMAPLASLDDGWLVRFQPGRGAPESIAMPRLSPLDESDEEGVKYFSGIATYSRNFTAPKGWKPGQRLWLDLGEVGDLAQVSVNGTNMGTAWHAPHRLDIGAAVKKGSNALEIRVANKWVNRLIGDAQPGATKITWTAMPTYRADAPLERSGLIGPVTLWKQD